MPYLAFRHRVSIITAALIFVTAAAPGSARATDVSCVGKPDQVFLNFKNSLNPKDASVSSTAAPAAPSAPPAAPGAQPASAAALAPLVVEPFTRFLPTGDDAKITFHAALSEKEKDKDKAAQFRMFETNGLNKATFESLGERDILSVSPPEKTEGGPPPPPDRTVIRFSLPDDKGSFWPARNFVVLRCIDGKVVDWGSLRAPTSNSLITFVICVTGLVLAYVLSMTAVRRVRNETHPLAAKYPAYRVSRPMTLRDFVNPIHLMADAFHRGSVQKFQVVMFSFLVGGLLLSLILRSGMLIGLSETIVGLLGISGIGAAVAQGSINVRNRLTFENWAWLVKKQVLPINEMSGVAPRWRDLVTTNREFDIYKLQTLIFSVAVAVALIVAGASSLATFRVPVELLGILALSQGIFVAGVLVRPPSVDDLDKVLTELREAEKTAKLAVQHNVDVDANGKLPALNAVPPNVLFPQRKANARNALERYKELADRAEIMIESTLETSVERYRLDPDIRENRRTLGPEGGAGGAAFAIDWIDDAADIHSLSVWGGAVIDAIQVTYRDRNTGQLTVGAKVGGPGGGLNQLDLDPGEYITRIEGRILASPTGGCVASMSVQTNRRRVPAGNARWGADGPQDRGYDFSCDAGEEIIGFEGRSGDFIDAIGAIVRIRR